MAGERARRGLGIFGTLYLVLGLYSVLVPVCAALTMYFTITRAGLAPWAAGALLGGGLVALGAATVLVLSRRLAVPLREVVQRVGAITRGELDGHLPVERDDEMGQLKRAINEMAAYLVVAREARVDRQYLQGVLDSMPDGLVVLDRNGVVELCNRPFAALLAYDDADAVRGLSLETLAGKQTPRWFKAVLEGRPLAMGSVTFRARRGQGVKVNTSVAVVRDTAEAPRSVILMARDTRDVAALERELDVANTRLAESAQFFQDLFDAIEDPITVLAPNGDVLQANKAARAVFGRDVVGRKCYRAFRMRDQLCEGCPAMETYASRHSTSVEHRVFGNAITRISTYPMLGKNGEITGIINHKRDVTKERQLEDLKAAFLAGVSHELRTPLTSIVGFNKLNIRRVKRYVQPALAEADERVRQALAKVLDDMEVMSTEGERLGRLVNDVLDLSKLEAGKLTLQMAEVEVEPLVQGAIAATSALWRAKGLDVQAQVLPGCPPAWGDADRLSQVLVNLLSNAIKFTSDGGIVVAVVPEETDLRFSVRDSGKGIPPEELPHVFEKFRQVADTRKGPPMGTGLGLPICRELVRLHEGRMWVESEPGVGSTFYFTVLRADRLDDFERSLRSEPSLTGL